MGFGGGVRGLPSRFPLLAALFIAISVLLAAAPSRTEAAPSATSGQALDAEEQAFLGAINSYRAANGLGPLSLNGQLNDAARWMSQDMAAKNYFSHTDSLGRDPFQRMADFGYNYNTWKGENLVAGTETAQAAFELWKSSPGHNANMLNANFKVIGIARAYGPGSTYGWYWTTDFGGQGEPPPPPAPPPPPPPPAPEPTPEPPPPAPPPPPPTPEPTPEPTPPPPPPTPEPTPAATPQPPSWQEIASQVSPWWQRLNLLDTEGRVLRAVSYMAERYLLLTTQGLVQEEGRWLEVALGDVAPGQLWLMPYKS